MFTVEVKQNQDIILVLGDAADHQMGRILWSHMGGQDVKIEFSETIDAFEQRAAEAILLVVILGDNDEYVHLPLKFIEKSSVSAEIMGVSAFADTAERVRLLGLGFDTVFNLDIITSPDFRNVLMVKMEKGRVRLRNAVQRSEYRRFRASLAASPDAFIVFDHEKRLFFVSQHYKKFYGSFSDKLVRGLPVADAFEMACAFHGMVPGQSLYERSAKFWLDLEGQIEFPLPDGRIWRCTATPLPDDQGTIVTTTDITDYMAQQKELHKKTVALTAALEKEKESSALQKQFIGMVSHEFRTPLTIIDGHAQLLQRRADQLDAETIRTRTKTIRSAVSRLVNMMESVLSSTLLKTGTMEPQPEAFDLSALLHELCDEQAALTNTHKITCQTDGMVPAIWHDRKMMILVMTNILANAVKFSRTEPVIHMAATVVGENIEISVQDNGVGIPADEVDKVFDRYYRASTSTGIPGSGIGLSLVHDLVGLMGGSVRVESQAGQGTKVVVCVPGTVPPA